MFSASCVAAPESWLNVTASTAIMVHSVPQGTNVSITFAAVIIPAAARERDLSFG
jgi:hypothetical protein